MNGTIYYFVLKNYKGIFSKKHKSNNHLLLIPIENDRYRYFLIVGKMEDDENTYACQLLATIKEDLLDDFISGEIEYFKGRFVEIEKLNCKTSQQAPGNYIIKLLKKGYNLLSNLILQYQIEYSTVNKRIYLLKADLNLVVSDINEDNISMVAAKQMAFLGKNRFESKKFKINSKSNRRIYFHD